MTTCGQEVELEPPTHCDPPQAALDSLAVVNRAHILRVLQESNWVVAGPSGATARLGVKRTTLNHRMKKLGISRSLAIP